MSSNRIKSLFDIEKKPVDPFQSLFASEPFDPIEWLFGRNSSVMRSSHAVEVSTLEDRYEVSVDVPGFSKDDLNVTVDDGVLLISGKIDNTEGNKRTRSEFTRRITLGDLCDAENVTATSKDGVLIVSIPKKPGAEPRKIEIE